MNNSLRSCKSTTQARAASEETAELARARDSAKISAEMSQGGEQAPRHQRHMARGDFLLSRRAHDHAILDLRHFRLVFVLPPEELVHHSERTLLPDSDIDEESPARGVEGKTQTAGRTVALSADLLIRGSTTSSSA